MPQFDATIKHLKDGVKGFTVSAATTNIEGWEATLEKIDSPEAKAVHKDLGNLKKHLHAKELDGHAIAALMAKLGKETIAISKKADGSSATKIQALGEALTHASENAAAKAA